MSKPWKCLIGWHEWVRRAGHDDPNDKVCLRCRKTRGRSVFGEGGARFG
jgi:hypothetical protein